MQNQSIPPGSIDLNAAAAPARRQYKLMIARFPYGGLEESDLTDWLVANVCVMKQHPHCHPDILNQKFNDTPITMLRNRAIAIAQQNGVDFLLMLDSDNSPDMCWTGNPNRSRLLESDHMVPFLPTAFDFLVSQRESGRPSVIAAPYCGPSPGQCVYVFQWCKPSNGKPDRMSLEMYPREEAARKRGIQEVAALPTGVILFDMKGFDKVKPPYTFYEMSDERELQKDSTEDVTCTRDLSMAGVPQYCHWSAWAGHWKRELVGPPTILSPAAVSEKYRAIVIEEYEKKKKEDEKKGPQPVFVERGGNLKPADFQVPKSTPENGQAGTNGHACPTLTGEGNDGPTFNDRPNIAIPRDDELLFFNALRRAQDDSYATGAIDAAADAVQEEIARRDAEKPWTFDVKSPTDNPPFITTMFDPELGCMSLAFRTGRKDLNALGQLAQQVYLSRADDGDSALIVELGSWVGESAVAMAKAVGADADVKIICVDTWEGAATDKTGDWAREVGKDWLQKVFRANTAKYLGKTIFERVGDVDEVGREWRGGKIDLLFIDAGHNYEEVKQSLAIWTRHVDSNGIICGHDYKNDQFPGVQVAVDEAFGKHVRYIPETYIWWVKIADLIAPKVNAPLPASV